MGIVSSFLPNLPNDYEYAIRSSKELEWLLECLGGSGRGLHDRLTSIQEQLPPRLVRKVRYVATIRNRLVHERGFNAIPDRAAFSSNVNECLSELTRLRAAVDQQRAPQPSILAHCSLM